MSDTATLDVQGAQGDLEGLVPTGEADVAVQEAAAELTDAELHEQPAEEKPAVERSSRADAAVEKPQSASSALKSSAGALKSSRQEVGKPAAKGLAKPSKLPAVSKAASTAPSARSRGPSNSGGHDKKGSPAWSSYPKPVDTSLALQRAGSERGNSSPGHVRTNVSSPSREEREQRKKWAEAAQRRQAKAAKRLMASQAEAKKEAEARLEARRAAVRARIEQEKGALTRMAAKRAALQQAAHQEADAGNAAGEHADGKSVLRKRASSPRPLYIRLAEDYERKQQAEEEEIRKKLEAQAAYRQVRVQALMSGQVIVKPLPDEARAKEEKELAKKLVWAPSGPYRADQSKLRSSIQSPHRSRAGSVNGADDEQLDSPTKRQAVQMEDNGMVLYNAGAGGAGLGQGNAARRGKLVTRRDHVAGGPGSSKTKRFSRVHVPVDRACSPFIVDPATQQPVNAPPQEQFWKGEKETASSQASTIKRVDGGSSKRLGALEQAPPPPPVGKYGAKGAASNKSDGDKSIKSPTSMKSSSQALDTATLAAELQDDAAMPASQQLLTAQEAEEERQEEGLGEGDRELGGEDGVQLGESAQLEGEVADAAEQDVALPEDAAEADAGATEEPQAPEEPEADAEPAPEPAAEEDAAAAAGDLAGVPAGDASDGAAEEPDTSAAGEGADETA